MVGSLYATFFFLFLYPPLNSPFFLPTDNMPFGVISKYGKAKSRCQEIIIEEEKKKKTSRLFIIVSREKVFKTIK
ncbi:hypothetical protein HOY82DRAFT_331187 [Tuber indicum]|nr:hypothetical protein HOY82DRAFT_331187 [Tuber indicum]